MLPSLSHPSIRLEVSVNSSARLRGRVKYAIFAASKPSTSDPTYANPISSLPHCHHRGARRHRGRAALEQFASSARVASEERGHHP